jgi:DNA-binding transcriptional MerR regulator
MSAHPDDPEGLSLQDLADETGLEPRTIRSYVEKGLLPGPDSLGRGARYPREALDRLRVLMRLRDADRGLSLEQIRVLLQGLSPARLHAIAAGRSSLDALWAAEPVASIAKGAALE